MQKKTAPINVPRQTWMSQVLFAIAFLLSLASFNQPAQANQQKVEKEWTFLLYLNGHNSLDSYGAYNINQMEEVGSNDNLNMVVQWASTQNGQTRRLLVKKDSDTANVTSPLLETLPAVDMGDYHSLIEFVKWGVQKFPAKHYMIAVWNHGNGWHLMNSGNVFHPNDISWDDNTGHHITTEELAVAIAESAKIIGHKVDVYGSDACLMAMAEIATQMKDSVSYFVGSEEVEPGYGWPYNTWMTRWTAKPQATAAEVSTYLTEEYVKAYNGGIYGNQDVTFSAYDMGKIDGLISSVKELNTSLANLSPSDFAATKTAAQSTLSFANDDYKDLQDFVGRMNRSGLGVQSTILSTVKQAISDFVISNGGTGVYSDAKGVSIWIPTQDYQLSEYRDRYSKLDFNKATNWLDFLDKLVK